MTRYTINAIGEDGQTYPLYFECADIVDAENIVRQTGLMADAAGVCEMIESRVEQQTATDRASGLHRKNKFNKSL